jgi:predicted transcriptional regulator
MEITSDILEAAKSLGKSQKQIIESLRKGSLLLRPLKSTRKIIFNLKEIGLIELQDDQLSLTILGHTILNYLDELGISSTDSLSELEERAL